MRTLAAIFVTLALPGHAQRSSVNLAPGRMLVATDESRDPAFEKTVVLLIQYDEQGGLGLIVNRRTNVALSRLFPSLSGKTHSKDLIYSGGPVTLRVMTLIRSSKKLDSAAPVFTGVQVSTNIELLEGFIAAAAQGPAFRVYVGYAGWSAPQLRSEVAHGFWDVVRGDAATVFDSNPESIWDRLHRRMLPQAWLPQREWFRLHPEGLNETVESSFASWGSGGGVTGRANSNRSDAADHAGR
ncbi:MAG: YqgE/AlgH family protein [Bryobacteraceae bacterium]